MPSNNFEHQLFNGLNLNGYEKITNLLLTPVGVLGTISRMAKTCALRMTPTKLYFILTDSNAVGGVSIWCELTQVCLNFFLLVYVVVQFYP